MFNLLEVEKTEDYTNCFTPYSPFIFVTQISTTNTEQDNYWVNVFGAENNYNSVQKRVTTVVLNYETEYIEEDSYADMSTQEESFYFDYDSQLLYVHVSEDVNIEAANLFVGITVGYSDDTVRYFDNQIYLPLITSIPTISYDADPLEYAVMSFSSGDVTLSNMMVDGELLFNGTEKLYGSNATIKRGEDGDSYDDLVTVFSGYINNATTSTTEETISIYDNRSKMEIDYPTDEFSTDDYANIGDNEGELIPDGYGNILGAEAYCTNLDEEYGQSMALSGSLTGDTGPYDFSDVDDDSSISFYVQLDDDASNNSIDLSEVADISAVTITELVTAINDEDCDITASSSSGALKLVYSGDESPSLIYIYGDIATRVGLGVDVDYKFAKVATSLDTVYIENDDGNYEAISTLPTLNSDATFTLDALTARTSSGTPRDCLVDARFRDYDNPADIIMSLNSVILGVDYNTSNYNTTEWESEKAYLADVSLYMDEEKSFYEWVEELQSGSNYGFRYEDSEKRTIRVDLKDRDLVTFADGTTKINPVDIRSFDGIDQNADLYASSVKVKYNYNNRTETYSSTTNDDYYNEVLREFRVALIDTYESLLVNETDAEFKASLIAEDEKTVRPLVSFTIEASKYTSPRIYDIIQAEVSMLVQDYYQENYTNLVGDDYVIGDDYALGELFGLTYTEAKAKGLVTYYGEFIGEVLNIEHNTDEDSITLTLRDITELRS